MKTQDWRGKNTDSSDDQGAFFKPKDPLREIRKPIDQPESKNYHERDLRD